MTGPDAKAARCVHDIKSWPESFTAILTGRKRFEVRRFDRPYRTGDQVLLHEWDPLVDYTGRKATYLIGFIQHGPPMPPGWCAFELLALEDVNRYADAILRAQNL